MSLGPAQIPVTTESGNVRCQAGEARAPWLCDPGPRAHHRYRPLQDTWFYQPRPTDRPITPGKRPDHPNHSGL